MTPGRCAESRAGRSAALGTTGHGFAKQYVRDHIALRTEPATNNVTDYGVKKAVEHLPELREKMGAVIDNYLNVQQDILETFLDRGQLRTLATPTVLPSARRIPGLKLDHPRQLALMNVRSQLLGTLCSWSGEPH
jgi:hypothetical protein